jgi:hypothetical protein
MEKATSYIKNNKFYLLGFFVLALALLANVFPGGYVFSGGDTSQFIEMKNNLGNLLYDWQGKAIIYYSIFYLLDFLKLSDSAQLSFYLGIFIVGSYISFGIFSKIVFRSDDKTRALTSIFYALNLYTLFLFTGNAGFSSYPTLYIFIPVLAGLFIKFITTEKNIYGALFALTILLGSSGFGNMAFVLSFSIFLSIIFLAFAVTGIIKIKKSLIARIFALGLFSFLISAYWFLPVFPSVKSGVEGLQNSDVLEFGYVIRHTASPLLNTLGMIYYSGDYFPDNFPYESLYFLKKIIIALAFLPVILISFGLFQLKSFQNIYKKYFLAFGAALIVMVMFIARVTEPFKVINHYLFNIWGMETLRGFDKTAVYFPFILASLLLIILSQLKSKKWLTAAMLVILLLPLPFYLGKIQQNMSYRFANASPKNKDFKKSGLSFLVKIPDEYYKIQKTINNDSEKVNIFTLPYSSNDGSGISNFPKWKMYGTDITKFLYNKTLLPGNAGYFSDWNFAQAFNDENNPDNRWLIKILGMMDVKYVIYHKDSTEDSVARSQEKMKNLEQDGLMKNLNDNDYFTLYEIKKDYILPYISWQNENLPVTSDLARIDGKLDGIKNNSQASEFREINPKKFEVQWDKNMSGKILVLSESYDSNWKAYAVSGNGEEKEIKNHIVARGYANGWQMNNADTGNQNIDHILIEYYPVRLMTRGLYISIATALFLLGYLLVYYYGKKNNNQKNNF